MRITVTLALAALLVLAAPAESLAKKNPSVEMVTSMGTIQLELYPAKAPKSVENFLTYVKAGDGWGRARFSRADTVSSGCWPRVGSGQSSSPQIW